MATRYTITSGGNSLLDVTPASAEYTSANLDSSLSMSDVYIEFFDAQGNAATPTAGTIEVYGLPTGNTWIAAVGSPVNAKDVTRPVAKYTPPMLDGLTVQVRVRFAGITGAARASVVIYKR